MDARRGARTGNARPSAVERLNGPDRLNGTERLRAADRLIEEIGALRLVLLARRSAVRDLTVERNTAMVQAALGGVGIAVIAAAGGVPTAEAKALVEVLEDAGWGAATPEEHVRRLTGLARKLSDRLAARAAQEQLLGRLVARAYAHGLRDPAYLAGVSGLTLPCVRQNIRRGAAPGRACPAR